MASGAVTVFEGLPSRSYEVVLADPPWSYYGDPTKDAAAGKHYNCLGAPDLALLPIPELLLPNGILFCWTTSTKMAEAIQLLEGWGLAFRGIQFVWVKTRRDGTVIQGQGPRPSIVKPTTEFVVAGSRKHRGRPLPLADESIGQVVLEPRREHSRKPDEVQDRLDLMYPDASRLELFARRDRCGWDVWGNELTFGCGSAHNTP